MDNIVTISYCDFFDSSVNGIALNEGDQPIIWGECNISWPPGWTEAQAREYRQKFGLLSASHHGSGQAPP